MGVRDFAAALLGAGPVEERAITFQKVWGAGGDWAAASGAVSVEAALGVPALLSCVDLIAGAVSTMPLQTFRTIDDRRERATDGPLVRAPSTVWPADEWVYVAVASMLLHGEAIGLITGHAANGYPSGVEWVDPRQVDVERDGPRLRYRVGGEHVDPVRVVHVRHGLLTPGNVRGQSPVSLLRSPLRAGLEQIVYGLDWFRGGGHPTGVLSIDTDGLTETQATEIADRFIEKTKTRRPVVLTRVANYTAVQSTPEASGLAEARRQVATDIAIAFHVPPEQVGGDTGRSMTYQTLETEQSALDVRALMPVYVRLERALSRLMPQPQYVRFNADAQIRPDTRTRAEVGEILVRSGQRSPDELRAKDELPPIPGGLGGQFAWPPSNKQAAPVAGGGAGGPEQ